MRRLLPYFFFLSLCAAFFPLRIAALHPGLVPGDGDRRCGFQCPAFARRRLLSANRPSARSRQEGRLAGP